VCVVVWVTPENEAMLDQLAAQDGLMWRGRPNRSDMVRKLLREAIEARVRKGWRPT
jgi:metal-responsive CopG/Arc/MetJ family transcriptional regulator